MNNSVKGQREFQGNMQEVSRLAKEETVVEDKMSPPHSLGIPTRSHEAPSLPPVPHSRSNPRQLRIERKDNGFGFTLRHFIVYPPEEGHETGPPIQEPMDTIFVKSVKEQGPAVMAGLSIGDRIVSVNGETVSGRSYAQVVQMIQNSRDSLYLVVVPRQDDILQVYFSEIAQNPESNQRLESGKPSWPSTSIPSSSSRESSPFSSKTSDSTRDSVYGHNPSKPYSARVQMAAAAVSSPVPPPATGWRARLQLDTRPPTINQPENIYEEPSDLRRGLKGGDNQHPLAPPSGSSSEHVYAAIPAHATGSTTPSLSSGGSTLEQTKSRESLDSDSSVLAGFTSQLEKIRRDCELKDEFLKTQTYPAYLSSPPKEVDQSPYGIASLASTMPPAVSHLPIKEEPPPAKPQKNFFMDIYAQEVSKMQSVSKIAAPTKKRNFDATQFNAYGLPLGYRRGNCFDNMDTFSRNNYVIVGSRTLHCEPPQVYQPTLEHPVCAQCYGGYPAVVPQMPAEFYHHPSPHQHHHPPPHQHHHPPSHQHHNHPHQHSAPHLLAVHQPPNALSHQPPYQPFCSCGCGAPCPACLPPPTPCPACSLMTAMTVPTNNMVAISGPKSLNSFSGPKSITGSGSHRTSPTPYHSRPTRPSTLPFPGIPSMQHEVPSRFQQQSLKSTPPPSHPPFLSSPVYMHPDPVSQYSHNSVHVNETENLGISPAWDTRSSVTHRRNKSPAPPEDEEEKNIRRTSYLQATKVERMEVEDNLATETGLAPTHSIKKLKSIFSEKHINSPEGAQPVSPVSPRLQEPPVKIVEQSVSPPSETTETHIREGYLTCKVAVVDGRKATDRSWKTVYAVLKSNALYMYKDKKMALENTEYEEKPVKLVESEVEVASDYTKRKNVFRVKTVAGSEYLFQAENEGLMKEWVGAIDDAAMAVIVDERKDSNKLRKLTSFRNRSPTGQSPSSKSRKSSAELPVPPYKDKDRDKKTWKGKMVKQLKKIGGSGSQGGPLYPEGGSIGVPLDECPLVDTEFVPYLVKVCCDIVTEKGLDIVGIYRIPGNNAAVTYLTEQINKGVDHFALDDQRWQDVNVVSSLLKSFFRKLPDPLFSCDMYSFFIEASKIEVASKRLDQLRKLVRELPEVHLETLKYMAYHLCQVADHASLNKMEVRNLAIVFGPTLVRATDDNMVSMVTDMSQQCRIIESILSNWDFFFNEDMDVETAALKESQTAGESEDQLSILGSGTSNQSLMLANLHKLEDAGKVGSPKGDVSAKDIVTSIISAANRKMLRAATKGSKKENSVEMDNERILGSGSRERLDGDGRRESEAVIHGALQIASAVPGLIGSLTGGLTEDLNDKETPEGHPGYSRQGSLTGGKGMNSRRGSLPSSCRSKRGSICEYSGGAVCEATPVGELCETRIAMMKSDKETFTNGQGEPQEVVTGKLSLVNVPGYPRVTSGIDDDGSCPHPPVISVPDPKFPIESYAGLDAATAERIAKFEAETKAMLDQRSGLAKSNLDLPQAVGSLPPHGSPMISSQDLSSLTTPVPPATNNPLEGGILVEDPYPTEAYNTQPDSYTTSPLGRSERRFLSLTYRTSLPNLHPEQETETPGNFDTNKVAARGTLQRMKLRPPLRPSLTSLGIETPRESSDPGQLDRCSEEEVTIQTSSQTTEELLNNLSASFDQKMRLLLDPHYQQTSEPQIVPNKKALDEARNLSLQQAKQGARKVELRRAVRVERQQPPRQQQTVLRPSNRATVKRADSLTKQEKTELNLMKARGESEKENSKSGGVAALREQFEQKAKDGVISGSKISKIDVNKLKKKLSDCSNRRIRRRHTVGGTKDFSVNLVNLIVRGMLVPLISDQEKVFSLSGGQLRGSEELRRFSLPSDDDQPDTWRHSMPLPPNLVI